MGTPLRGRAVRSDTLSAYGSKGVPLPSLVRAWEGKENIKKNKKRLYVSNIETHIFENPSKRPIADDGEAMKKIEIRVITPY